MKKSLFLLTVLSSFIPLHVTRSRAAATSPSNQESIILKLEVTEQENWQTWRDTALFYASHGDLSKSISALQKSRQLLK